VKQGKLILCVIIRSVVYLLPGPTAIKWLPLRALSVFHCSMHDRYSHKTYVVNK